jgi:hypothetical protein
MDLYLMQHGEAKAESEDPARPILAFRMGAFVALEREAEGFRLRFMLPPELVVG